MARQHRFIMMCHQCIEGRSSGGGLFTEVLWVTTDGTGEYGIRQNVLSSYIGCGAKLHFIEDLKYCYTDK